MSSSFLRGVLPLALAGLGLLALACSPRQIFRPLCASDAECWNEHEGNHNWTCVDRGECVCKNDQACSLNEHCSPLPSGDGACHPDALCSLNTDCTGAQICGKDGICHNGCKSDLECRVGQVCDTLHQECIDGCWNHDDCISHQACTCADQPGGFCSCTDPGHFGCEIGRCQADVCPDATFCAFGDLCVPDAQGTPRCVADNRGPYCESCTIPPGEAHDPCASQGPNFCLIDPNDPTRVANYCGVDCYSNQACPNGYYCRDVLRLTSAACQANTQCAPTPDAPTCQDDSGCEPGATCKGGHCAGTCILKEGAFRGYCSCVQDSDCPVDACGSDGFCTISRQACFAGGNDPCHGYIRCVNDGTHGYCRIGRNCTPAGGLSCSEIRQGGAP